MPITIPKHLPARKILEKENIFVMDDERATTQDIRPLSIAILNLMPEKEKTETQILRLLSNSPLQLHVTFLHTATYQSKNTKSEHLQTFYETFAQIRHRKFDGLIITGAPVETLSFKDVDYWNELTEIMEWSTHNVTSTLHICWGAQAGLYYHYNIEKQPLEEKCFGVFWHELQCDSVDLVKGFDDIHRIPHSRHTTVLRNDIENCEQLKLISYSEEAGVCLVMSKDGRHVFLTGHPEYDAHTLKDEYERDIHKGLQQSIPVHYFPKNNPTIEPKQTWRSHANLLFSNWLNYYVYQATPYIWE